MTRDKIRSLMSGWSVSTKKGISIQLTYSEVRQAIEFLVSDLGKGKNDDPFNNLDDTLIREFALYLNQLGQPLMAIAAFKEFYQKCVELEFDFNERIHKGDTLHWISIFYLKLKEHENAFNYSILTLIDDVISEHHKTRNKNGDILIPDSMNAPISEILQLNFHMPKVNLEYLRENTLNVLHNNKNVYNPELVVFLMREKGYAVPRYCDYKYYNPSYPSLRKKYENIVQKSDHKEWEKFAALLFSSVEGFEPIIDVKPGYSSYQFDVVIRNVTRHDFSIPWIGEYFAIECKYYNESSVGVNDLDHFASKLKYHDFKCGIFFTKTPISGWKNDSEQVFGKLVQTKIFNRQGIIIFDLTKNDIESILQGKNLIETLFEKYEQVRLEL